MKIKLITTIAILICHQFASGQQASDVLENGIQIKTGQKLFLQYDNNVLKFDAAKSLQDITNPPDFIPLEDSTIFLVSKNGLNVYLRPLNPLNYNYNTENKVVIDPINEAATTAMGAIFDVLGTVTPTKAAPSNVPDGKVKVVPQQIECATFKTLHMKIELVQTKLADNKQTQTNEIFNHLKALTFLDEESTKADLATIKASIIEVENHFSEVVDIINELINEVKTYDCDFPEAFTAQYIFNAILKDLAVTTEEQKKRFNNLLTAYNLVEKAQQTASVGGGEVGLRWCFKLDGVPSKEGEISIYTITIKESGYILSDKKEIIKIESKEVLKRTLRVRKFQRFVPEASVGTAFTFFKYNTYGTTSDSTGQQLVGSPNENVISNLNITTMLNFNYFIPNSPIHPLYQIGVGINTGIPTLLTGFGLRSNINGIRRMTISGGIAMSWIKELDKLNVGDKISGTDDIEKDYKYSSAPIFTPYFGLQYNF